MLSNCLSFAFSNTHGLTWLRLEPCTERKLQKLFARRSVQLFFSRLYLTIRSRNNSFGCALSDLLQVDLLGSGALIKIFETACMAEVA